MAWTLNGIRIFTQDYAGGNNTQNIARLQPISGQTILQTFGYDKEVRKLSGFVVGTTDLNALVALKTTGLTYALTSYEGSEGNWEVRSVNWTRLNIISQTMRPDLPCESPVYMVEVELY
jgi:hypothetical protein